MKVYPEGVDTLVLLLGVDQTVDPAGIRIEKIQVVKKRAGIIERDTVQVRAVSLDIENVADFISNTYFIL